MRRTIIPALVLAAFLLGPGVTSALGPGSQTIPASAFAPVVGHVRAGESDPAGRTGAPNDVPGDPRLSRTAWRSPARGVEGSPGAPLPPLLMAQEWALARLGPREYACLDRIVWRESRWDPAAVNLRSGAFGLGQSMTYRNPDPRLQLRWAISYGNGRYGSMCAAWTFWQHHGWW